MSRMQRTVGKLSLLVALGAMQACAGTDTGNPLVGADVSGCKSERASGGTLSVQALTSEGRDPAHYVGFKCLRWERSGERLRFDAFNFGGGCGIAWKPGLKKRASGGFDLVVRNPSCAVARCGGCLYDASFEVDATMVDLAETNVSLVSQDCHGASQNLGKWMLRADGGASELQCEYAEGLEWQARRAGLCGQANMPCSGRDCPGGTAPEPCASELTCTDVGGNASPRCLAQCAHDDECQLSEVMSCQNGVCVLRAK